MALRAASRAIPRMAGHLPNRVWRLASVVHIVLIEMRSLLRTLATALMAALLLPALASALAPCGMPDCPTVECGAQASKPGHDCWPAADDAVAAPSCEQHVEAPATPSRLASNPAERAVVRIDARDPGASSEEDLSWSSKGHPHRALDCLSQSCVLRI